MTRMMSLANYLVWPTFWSAPFPQAIRWKQPLLPRRKIERERESWTSSNTVFTTNWFQSSDICLCWIHLPEIYHAMWLRFSCQANVSFSPFSLPLLFLLFPSLSLFLSLRLCPLSFKKQNLFIDDRSLSLSLTSSQIICYTRLRQSRETEKQCKVKPHNKIVYFFLFCCRVCSIYSPSLLS